MDVAIITSGYLPVPPTKGGAVENIIYNLIKKNEIYRECHFTVFSIEDDHNETFYNTDIEYIKVSTFSKFLDKCLYFFAKNLFRKDHLISYRYFFQRMEFLGRVGEKLSNQTYDKVILENNIVMFKALEKNDNFVKYKGKIYYHAHNELGKTLGYEKYLVKLTKIITVSDYIQKKYRQYVNGENVKFETVHNVIDEGCFKPIISETEVAELKNKLAINNDYPILLFVGRISEEKGIKELFRALSLVNTNKYNLLIVGKSFFGTEVRDAFEANLNKMAREVKGKVIFTGLVKYQDMYKYYKLADLCILPSMWNEPCALTIIECIVCGTPLITTNTGGTPELISNATIMLNTENLVNRLANTVEELLNDLTKLKFLKESSKKQIYKYGTLDVYYQNFVNSLRD